MDRHARPDRARDDSSIPRATSCSRLSAAHLDLAPCLTELSKVETAPWAAGRQSLRALLVPGLLLQAVAVGAVLAYYFLPAAAGVFATPARWQSTGGFAFSAASTALCGG